MSLLEHVLISEEYKFVLIELFWYKDYMIEIFDNDSLPLKQKA